MIGADSTITRKFWVSFHARKTAQMTEVAEVLSVLEKLTC